MHALLLNNGRPTVLRTSTGRGRLLLDVKMQYRLVEEPGPRGPWRVRTAAYQYRIETENGQEVISFHWHPRTPSPTTYPHVHIGSVALQPNGVLDHKDHVPTGRVALQAVVRHAVELGAHPIRDDWEERLMSTQDEFLKESSWR